MSYYDDLEKEMEEMERERTADRVAAWSPLSSLPLDQRKKHADTLGANWANIMSGMGDQ